MIIKPYSNVVIDLARTPLVIFSERDQMPGKYNFQVDSNDTDILFEKAGIEAVKQGVDVYNQTGGSYFWLFTNVALNLDVVGMVTLMNNRVNVTYPGGTWTSSPGPYAVNAFERYTKEMEDRARNRKPVIRYKNPPAEKGAEKSTGKTAGKDKPVSEEALKTAMSNIDNMIGLESAKRDIRQNIALARFNAAKRDMGMDVKPISRHMVFTGNPGTGKTTFAREVAKVYHALGFLKTDTVTEVKREDLVAEYTGQTAPKVKAALEKARGGVLFIDEAYSLVRDQSAFRDAYGTEAIDTLVAGMENMRDDLIVIVAGYPDPMKKLISSNEGLKSRFTTYINFDDYSMNDLGLILDLMVADRGYTIAPEAREKALELLAAEKSDAEARHDPSTGLGCDFGNGREVRNLVEQAEKRLASRLDNDGVFSKDPVAANDDEAVAAHKALLSTITLDDIKDIRLGGLLDRTPNKSAISQRFAL